MNVPRTWSRIDAPGCPLAQRCVLSAIDAEMRVIADESLPPLSRWRALKFLGHWVADIHQPLHVSYRDDLGGNKVKLTGDQACKKNLHAYWDRCLIDALMSEYKVDQSEQLARALLAGVSADQRRQWLSASDPWQWADESLQLVRQPAFGYCRLDGVACLPLATSAKQALADDYSQRWSPTAARRLTQAGIRLAGLIDRALAEPSAAMP